AAPSRARPEPGADHSARRMARLAGRAPHRGRADGAAGV
ncbi:MAG: hypothetical protein AVDCRST_MAG36-2362, partial [uncultured Nocardioidaceae bacterium]